MKTKKLLSLALTLIMILSLIVVNPYSISAKEKVYESKGCKYTLDKKGNATVVELTDSISLTNKIPSKLNGHTVTKINFQENSKNGKIDFYIPDKLRIPKTVKYISKTFTKYIKSYCGTNKSTPYYRIVCDKGSYAQKYMLKNKFVYILSGEHKTSGDLGQLIGYYGYKLYDKNGKNCSAWNFTSMTFNGKERKAQFTIKVKNYTLKKNKDYTVKYYNNIAVGTALIELKGIGNYTGITYIRYKIIPPKEQIVSLKKSKSNETTINAYIFESYNSEYKNYNNFSLELQYSTDKNFKSKKSIKASSKNDANLHVYVTDKVSYIYFSIPNLKKDKKYYFRLRNYCKTVDIMGSESKVIICGQHNIYSKWSKVKNITL